MKVVRFLLVAAVPFALLGCPDSAKPDPASGTAAKPAASGAAAAAKPAASAEPAASGGGAGW